LVALALKGGGREAIRPHFSLARGLLSLGERKSSDG
jgi:hypothetical protein